MPRSSKEATAFWHFCEHRMTVVGYSLHFGDRPAMLAMTLIADMSRPKVSFPGFVSARPLRAGGQVDQAKRRE